MTDPMPDGVAIVAAVENPALRTLGSDAINQQQHVPVVPTDSLYGIFPVGGHDFVPFQANIAARICEVNLLGGNPYLATGRPT
jgi:hypothetical protein